jgi:hypothetical protein
MASVFAKHEDARPLDWSLQVIESKSDVLAAGEDVAMRKVQKAILTIFTPTQSDNVPREHSTFALGPESVLPRQRFSRRCSATASQGRQDKL